jgi:hypothetical protein
MVDGSPYRLVRDAEALASTSNRDKWLEGHGIVDPTPRIAYAPK